MTRALYVSPMAYGANSAVDALCHGLESRLAENAVELRLAYADFAEPGWPDLAEQAVLEGLRRGVDAVVLWVIDPTVPAGAVAQARAQGVPVVTMERPRYPVDASVVYPNFNHGVYMSEYLATLLPSGAHVGLIGGPDVVDDIELMLGIRHGLQITGLDLVNDPEDERYKNASDVAAGGREKTANLLADFAELDGLIPFNDETTLGAIEALRDSGRLGSVLTISRNGTPNVVELVRAGLHQGTWDIDAPGIGQTVADLVVRQVLHGEQLDGMCVCSPVGRMITPERAASWVPWQDRIPYNPLKPLEED
jgi:ABC-type sugar transport system substrate-binding protein